MHTSSMPAISASVDTNKVWLEHEQNESKCPKIYNPFLSEWKLNTHLSSNLSMFGCVFSISFLCFSSLFGSIVSFLYPSSGHTFREALDPT